MERCWKAFAIKKENDSLHGTAYSEFYYKGVGGFLLYFQKAS